MAKFNVGDVVCRANNVDMTILSVGDTKYFVSYISDAFKNIKDIDDQWELKPKEIPMTEEKFHNAWRKVFGDANVRDLLSMKKELGF